MLGSKSFFPSHCIVTALPLDRGSLSWWKVAGYNNGGTTVQRTAAGTLLIQLPQVPVPQVPRSTSEYLEVPESSGIQYRWHSYPKNSWNPLTIAPGHNCAPKISRQRGKSDRGGYWIMMTRIMMMMTVAVNSRAWWRGSVFWAKKKRSKKWGFRAPAVKCETWRGLQRIH